MPCLLYHEFGKTTEQVLGHGAEQLDMNDNSAVQFHNGTGQADPILFSLIFGSNVSFFLQLAKTNKNLYEPQ